MLKSADLRAKKAYNWCFSLNMITPDSMDR